MAVQPDRCVRPRPFREVIIMRYIGLDVGKKYVQACLLNEDGSILREQRYRYDEDGLRDILSLLDDNDMAVLESTGNLWVRIYDLLKDKGVRVKLANPLKLIWFMLVRREVYHGFDVDCYGRKLSRLSR